MDTSICRRLTTPSALPERITHYPLTQAGGYLQPRITRSPGLPSGGLPRCLVGVLVPAIEDKQNLSQGLPETRLQIFSTKRSGRAPLGGPFWRTCMQRPRPWRFCRSPSQRFYLRNSHTPNRFFRRSTCVWRTPAFVSRACQVLSRPRVQEF